MGIPRAWMAVGFTKPMSEIPLRMGRERRMSVKVWV
jgi:hypothetical protein